jgi:hypothetical protein
MFNRSKLARSSGASARRTSDKSCHVANSSARNSATGGQPGSLYTERALTHSGSPAAHFIANRYGPVLAETRKTLLSDLPMRSSLHQK